MGGWKLEAGRFLLLIAFPVGSFWAFNQSGIFEYAVGYYEYSLFSFYVQIKQLDVPLHGENNEEMRKWKESLMEARRKKDYELFQQKQTEFEVCINFAI